MIRGHSSVLTVKPAVLGGIPRGGLKVESLSSISLPSKTNCLGVELRIVLEEKGLFFV